VAVEYAKHRIRKLPGNRIVHEHAVRVLIFR